MERHFDEDLNQFKTDLLKMATLTEEAIHRSLEALKAQDKDLAQTVIVDDKKIDEYENSLEQNGLELLARYQPMAKDLRFITTGVRVCDELERIADLIVNICQRTIDIADKPLLKPLVDIPKLAANARKMVKNSIDAFVKEDKALAKQVILDDRVSNDLRTLIMQELINDFIVKDGKTASRAIPLLLIARDLERVSDHASSIAEDVIYMIEAKVVRHHPERLNNGGDRSQG